MFPQYCRDNLTLHSQPGVCKRAEAVLAMLVAPYGTAARHKQRR